MNKEVQLYKGKYGQMSVEDVKDERIYGLKRLEGMKLLEFFFVIFFPIWIINVRDIRWEVLKP